MPITDGSNSVTLRNVQHVPSLDTNLISVSALDTGGRSVLFGGRVAWVIPGNF